MSVTKSARRWLYSSFALAYLSKRSATAAFGYERSVRGLRRRVRPVWGRSGGWQRILGITP
jgi:hypothetical protein